MPPSVFPMQIDTQFFEIQVKEYILNIIPYKLWKLQQLQFSSVQ